MTGGWSARSMATSSTRPASAWPPPYSPPPTTAKLRVFETQEVAGLIFAWWGIGGRAPQWSLPDDVLDQAGWTGLKINTLRFPGHPQETTENSVDVGHLRYVHGYDSVDRVGRVSVDGPRLERATSTSGAPGRLPES